MVVRLGRTALVTGGGRGIGRGIADHLGRAGWDLVVLEIDPEAARSLEAQQRRGLAVVRGDVSIEGDAERAVQVAVERYGHLDALVNNAGLASPQAPHVGELDYGHFRRVLSVNLDGAFLCVRAAMDQLVKSRGAIVNIASTRALQSEPNSEAYAASKGALLALTHALAMSLGPRVRVNAVSPGWIDTSEYSADASGEQLRVQDHLQHPAGRVGKPSDVAQMVEFLLDPERSGFITGQNFVLDGGMTRKMIYLE